MSPVGSLPKISNRIFQVLPFAEGDEQAKTDVRAWSNYRSKGAFVYGHFQ